jgi:hypothetical protein
MAELLTWKSPEQGDGAPARLQTLAKDAEIRGFAFAGD